MRRVFLLLFFFSACGHSAPRVTALQTQVDADVARELLDERVEESVREIDPHATKVGAFLHGVKGDQDVDPCLAPNCGLPELEWSVALEPGCYWLIAAGGNRLTSLQAKLEGRAVVSTQNEYCVPMAGPYRVSASAGGHGPIALGVYRKTKR